MTGLLLRLVAVTSGWQIEALKSEMELESV